MDSNHLDEKLAKEKLSRQARELEALYKTSLEINAQLNLPILLKAIVNRAAELTGTPMGGLYLVKASKKTLELVVSHNLPIDYTGTTIKFGEGLSGIVAQTGQVKMVENYQTWDGRAKIYIDAPFCRVLGVPLKVQGKVIGVINVTDDVNTGPFSDEEVALVSLFADQAAIAVQNAHLFEQAQREITERKQAEEKLTQRNRELALLNRLIAASSSTLDPDTVLDTILRELAIGINVSQASAALFEKNGAQLVVVNEYPPMVPPLSAIGATIPVEDNHSAQYVLENRKPLAITEVQTDDRIAPMRDLLRRRQVLSILLVPLIIRDKVLGILGLDSYERREFTNEEISLAANASAAAAQAIENARLYVEVQQLAITDTLTGLYNRRGLLELGEREVERARRYRRSLSAIVMDLDHFKEVNDRFNHAVGDQILIGVARLCRQSVRGIDILGRPGGDEFVILMPEANFNIAIQAAERIRLSLARTPIATSKTEITITGSLGVAELTKQTPELAVLIDQADQAMYEAKQTGRNRVCAGQD